MGGHHIASAYGLQDVFLWALPVAETRPAEVVGAAVGRSPAVQYWEMDTAGFRAAGMAARNLTVAPID